MQADKVRWLKRKVRMLAAVQDVVNDNRVLGPPVERLVAVGARPASRTPGAFDLGSQLVPSPARVKVGRHANTSLMRTDTNGSMA